MMNKTLFIFFLILCFSCTNDDDNIATFYSGNQKIVSKNMTYYVTKNESVYLYIKEKEITSKISNIIIDSIKLSISGKEFSALPLRLMHSKRDEKHSDFLFPVDDNTGKIILDDYNGKRMFTIVTDKTDITKLIKPQLID